MSRNHPPDPTRGRGVALLWTAALLGPITWLLQLEANYTLAYRVCRTGGWWIYLLVGALALAIVGLGGVLAWKLQASASGMPDEIAGRVRMMTSAGIAGAVYFGLVIVATTIPGLVLRGCP